MRRVYLDPIDRHYYVDQGWEGPIEGNVNVLVNDPLTGSRNNYNVQTLTSARKSELLNQREVDQNWIEVPRERVMSYEEFSSDLPAYYVPQGNIVNRAMHSSSGYKKRFEEPIIINDNNKSERTRSFYPDANVYYVTSPKQNRLQSLLLNNSHCCRHQRAPAVGGTISKNVFGTSGTYTLNCNLTRPVIVGNDHRRKCIYEKGSVPRTSDVKNARAFLNPQSRVNISAAAVDLEADSASDCESMMW